MDFPLPVPEDDPDVGIFWRCQFNENWLPVVVGILEEAIYNANSWTPGDADIVQKVATLIDQIMTPIQENGMLGTILAYATTIPPADLLPCNGASYARASYPDLYEVLDPEFIISESMFRVPNLNGKVVLGTGGNHDIGEQGGAERVSLSRLMLPDHTHFMNPDERPQWRLYKDQLVNPGWGYASIQSLTYPIPSTTVIDADSRTGDLDYEGASSNPDDYKVPTMPPFLALNYGIVFR